MQGLDEAQRKQRLVEAVRTLTLRGAQRRPLFLLMEDLQWIDSSSRDYLDSVVDSLASQPVFLLCTYREGYTPAWDNRAFHQRAGRSIRSPRTRRRRWWPSWSTGPPVTGPRARAHRQARGGQSPLHRGAHRLSERSRAAGRRRRRRAWPTPRCRRRSRICSPRASIGCPSRPSACCRWRRCWDASSPIPCWRRWRPPGWSCRRSWPRWRGPIC